MTLEMMEYMVWVIEVTAEEFFSGDKTTAYNTLKDSGVWTLYIETYDTTHSLGREYLVNEMREQFVKSGVNI